MILSYELTFRPSIIMDGGKRKFRLTKLELMSSEIGRGERGVE
jgi:hypothetical protein